MKAQSINGYYEVPECVKHVHLDVLLAVMRLHMLIMGQVSCSHSVSSNKRCQLACVGARIVQSRRRLGFQADTASLGTQALALYRVASLTLLVVPCPPLDRWAAGVAFLCAGIAMVAFHYSMPFGATSSVLAWHWVGDLILCIARRILHLPLTRYVDDYSGPERQVLLVIPSLMVLATLVLRRPETMRQGMNLFARLVRMLLGADAISDAKLEYGTELSILGMLVCVAYVVPGFSSGFSAFIPPFAGAASPQGRSLQTLCGQGQ